jgi:hypothetical protein
VKPASRWVLVTALLAVALVVALWPQSSPPTAPISAGATSAGAARPAGDSARLEQLRSRAALQPCPAAPAGSSPVRGPLSGLVLPCLGHPGTVDLGAALAGRPALPLSYVVSADGRVDQVNPPEVLRTPAQVRAVVARYLGPGAVE